MLTIKTVRKWKRDALEAREDLLTGTYDNATVRVFLTRLIKIARELEVKEYYNSGSGIRLEEENNANNKHSTS